jgi:hypothetical protein
MARLKKDVHELIVELRELEVDPEEFICEQVLTYDKRLMGKDSRMELMVRLASEER